MASVKIESYLLLTVSTRAISKCLPFPQKAQQNPLKHAENGTKRFNVNFDTGRRVESSGIFIVWNVRLESNNFSEKSNRRSWTTPQSTTAEYTLKVSGWTKYSWANSNHERSHRKRKVCVTSTLTPGVSGIRKVQWQIRSISELSNARKCRV